MFWLLPIPISLVLIFCPFLCLKAKQDTYFEHHYEEKPADESPYGFYDTNDYQHTESYKPTDKPAGSFIHEFNIEKLESVGKCHVYFILKFHNQLKISFIVDKIQVLN